MKGGLLHWTEGAGCGILLRRAQALLIAHIEMSKMLSLLLPHGLGMPWQENQYPEGRESSMGLGEGWAEVPRAGS